MSPASSDVVERARVWLAAAEPQPWIIETSGSTGTPKRVRLSRAALLASVRASAERLGARGQWLLALPGEYVAGLQVICRSLDAGFDPVVHDRYASFATAAAAMTAEHRFVSLVPTQLHRLLETDAESLRSFHTVLLGGGPIDPSLRTRATAAGVRVVATYGSAETAGGCVYDGLPLDGVAVAIGDGGRIRIAGPTLFDGYDDPALTASTLVGGWFLTSDAGRIDEDGLLRVLGRVDDMVITGGVNVPAPVVARRLREHPDVEAAEVLGVPDEEWGQRLVAFVVGTPDLEALRAWVAEQHPRSWAPRQLVVLPELPLLANGKPDRMRLKELA